MFSNKWVIVKKNESAEDVLISSLGLSPVVARVLANREITTPELARVYLDPSLSDIPNPFDIPDMEKATSRIIAALNTNEKIGIFGDYDADGITATALVFLFLKAIGHTPLVSLPDRRGEGYGLTETAVDNLKSQGAKLIITVDNGTRSIKAISHAKKNGLDTIVTDHHSVGDELPSAYAIVNPRLYENLPHLKDLSGCGVAFMLVAALRKRLREHKQYCDIQPNLKQHLDLVALGTIADMMSLTNINRILVRHGLQQIVNSTKTGMKALLEVSGTNKGTLTAHQVAFQLAPRVNAAGRIGNPYKALELLFSNDEEKSREIAGQLDNSNRTRHSIETKILKSAVERLEKDINFDKKSSIVLHSKDWHVGVIGIVAAKLVQQYNLPTIIISSDSKPARGSARGAQGIDLVEVLTHCESHLVKFGGHSAAAGLSIEEDKIASFSEVFDNVCKKYLPAESAKKLSIDAVVRPQDITGELVKELSKCWPFGNGNPEPIFVIANMNISERRVVGSTHLKMRLSAQNISFDAIGFGMAEELPSDAKQADFAFTPEFNTWNGVTTVQLRIKDFKI